MEPNKNMQPVTPGSKPMTTPNTTNPSPMEPVASPDQYNTNNPMGETQIAPPFSSNPMAPVSKPIVSEPMQNMTGSTTKNNDMPNMSSNMTNEPKPMASEIFGQDTQSIPMATMPVKKKSNKNIILIILIIVLIIIVGIVAWTFLI